MGRKKLSKKEKHERQKEREAYKVQGARMPVKTPSMSQPVTQVIWGLVFLAIACLSTLALLSEASPAGKIFGVSLEFSFGWGRWLFPILLGFAAVRLIVNAFAPKKPHKDLAGLVKPKHLVPPVLRFFGWGLSYLFFLSILTLIAKTVPPDYAWGGGWFGWMLSQPTAGFFGVVGAFIFDIFMLFLGIVIAEQDNLFILWEKLFHKTTGSLLLDPKKEDAKFGETKPVPVVTFTTANVSGKKPKLDLKSMKPVDDINSHPKIAPWKGQNLLPPLDLLSRETREAEAGDVQEQAETIRKTLLQFGIAVEMGEVKIGPTVTQYTLKPAEGIKLGQILNLKNNLAMALAAHSLRIEAPIPGTTYVGIEVPNKVRAIVPLRLVLESEDYQARKQHQLIIALGQDVSGKPWVSDIAKMPHLLIAGATGTGKSVCINTIIVSLLFGHTPEQLRLILVDPKRGVEMGVYNNLPHLLLPVVTEVSKTVTALKWALVEMDRRYKELQKYGKKNIDAWNEWIEEQKESAERPDKMPFIVIVIDELADLMSVAQAEVENSIHRLTSIARAVGIHLVLATQRPSVDVITGLIKMNVPTRIAFMVPSGVDSRTILDEKGAEDLSGQGDMLYSAADVAKPRRLQGCLVTEKEINKVVEFWSKTPRPSFQPDVVAETKSILPIGGPKAEDDPLLIAAAEVCFQSKKGSASLLQRRLSIGYPRAASLLDELENLGVLGAADGARPREVLSNAENIIREMSGGGPTETPVE